MNPVSAIMGVLGKIPASTARAALGKVDPRFNGYFSKAISYGIDANRAIDYLSERFESDSQKQYKRNLEQGAANKTLRPDEMVSRSEMNNASIPGKIVKTAAASGAGALAGGPVGAASQVAGSLSGKGQAQQLTQEQSQGTPQEQSVQQNDMSQDDFSDILNAVQNRMQQGGRSLDQASQEVGMHPNFKPRVKQIEQSGVKFMDWVRQQLGGQQGQQGQQGQNQGAGAERLMALLQSRPKR